MLADVCHLLDVCNKVLRQQDQVKLLVCMSKVIIINHLSELLGKFNKNSGRQMHILFIPGVIDVKQTSIPVFASHCLQFSEKHAKQ